MNSLPLLLGNAGSNPVSHNYVHELWHSPEAGNDLQQHTLDVAHLTGRVVGLSQALDGR